MTAAVHPFPTSLRPWLSSGVALVGAGAIALAPITPSSPAMAAREATHAISAQISAEAQLAALEWPYILSLPILRQWVTNRVEVWAVWLGGFAQAGIGLVQSLLTIPGVTVEVIQQLLDLNFVGAFETVTGAIRDAAVAIGQPLVDSWVRRNGAVGAVQEALSTAIPQAIVSATNGFLTAANVVTISLIEGTQGLVTAVLTFNLGNIIDATVDGTKNFVIALGDGAQSIIGGIEDAQRAIAEALAARPETESVTDISALRTGDASPGVVTPFKTVTLDTGPAPKPPEVLAASDAPQSADIAVGEPDPTTPPRVTPVKDLVARVEDSAEKLNDRVQVGREKAEDAVKKVVQRVKARANDAEVSAAKKRVKADVG